MPRYGHTTIYFNNQFFMFGGVYDWHLESESPHDDIIILNLGNKLN